MTIFFLNWRDLLPAVFLGGGRKGDFLGARKGDFLGGRKCGFGVVDKVIFGVGEVVRHIFGW